MMPFVPGQRERIAEVEKSKRKEALKRKWRNYRRGKTRKDRKAQKSTSEVRKVEVQPPQGKTLNQKRRERRARQKLRDAKAAPEHV